MKYLYILCLFFINQNISSQTLELFGGISNNKFYDVEENRSFDSGSYASGFNSFLGIGFHQINLRDFEFSVTISYERYGGDIYIYSGGRGGGRELNAEVNKSILSFGIFPFSKKVYKELDISVGVVFSSLLREKFSGSEKFTISSTPSSIVDQQLDEQYQQLSTSNLIGIKGNLSYEFKLTDTYILSPQYSYYIGLYEEFMHFTRAIKTMRYNVGFGIKKKL